MKRIFTCSALALGVIYSAHIVGAMDAMENLDGIALYHYNTSVPTDDVFQLSWKKAAPTLEDLLTPQELARFNANLDLRELRGIESSGPSNSNSSTNFMAFSKWEKITWSVSYGERKTAGRWVEHRKKNRIFIDTFAKRFGAYFKDRNGMNISNDLYEMLCECGAGNRVDISLIMTLLLKGSSFTLFYSNELDIENDLVMENIGFMIERGIIRSKQSGTYNFVGLLTIDDDKLNADALYSQIDKMLLYKIKETIGTRNSFVQDLSSYLFSHKEYSEEIKSEFKLGENSDLNNIAEHLTFTEPGERWEIRQALRKFLGHQAFFDVDYDNRKCTLKGALAGQEHFVKFDLTSFRLYVDTEGLTNWNLLNASYATDAVRDFILCYHQYMYEEFVMDRDLREAFTSKIASADYFPYDRNSLKRDGNISIDRISTSVLNGEQMKRVPMIFEKLSAESLMSTGNIQEKIIANNNYATDVFLNGVKMLLGMGGALEPKYIALLGNAWDAIYVSACKTPKILSYALQSYSNFRQRASELMDNKGGTFKTTFLLALQNISNISSLHLGNWGMIRYLFGALDKAIKGDDRDLTAAVVGYLMHGFNNCSNEQTNALRLSCLALLAREPSLGIKDKIDMCIYFENEDAYKAEIVPQLAWKAFLPEVLVERLIANFEGFKDIADLFVRIMTRNSMTQVNWGYLDDQKKKQIALDMLVYFGYVKQG